MSFLFGTPSSKLISLQRNVSFNDFENPQSDATFEDAAGKISAQIIHIWIYAGRGRWGDKLGDKVAFDQI